YVAERWWCARHWRPVQVIAEIAFLWALAAFVLWPWWRSAEGVWYVVHLAWLPWLFLLPYWLGYAPPSATTFSHPQPGVLYPVMLVVAPQMEAVESEEGNRALFQRVPRPLASLPGNPLPVAVAFFSVPPGYGPHAAAGWSAVLGVASGFVLMLWIGVRKD